MAIKDVNNQHSAPTGEGSGAMEGSGGGGQRQGMLAVNDLNYVLAPDLSVSVNNTFKNHFFQSSVYTNTQRAICILNSGADYGDTRSSTLNFQVEITAPTTLAQFAYFGKHGSILNIIKNVTISSRSGDEISRVNDRNHLSAMTNGFKYSKGWVESVGGSIGYGGCLMPSTNTVNGKFHYSIPLYLLSDFFGYGRLMPAMVLAGLRIEIEWEDPAKAFQSVNSGLDAVPAAAITGYTVTTPYVSLRSVQLTDGTQRALNEMSAVNGLEIVYCDHERTETTFTGKSLNMEVRKAASRALKAYASSRPVDGDEYKRDSFRTEAWDYTQWQWQLGALYFPQQPIKSKGGKPRENLSESYNQTLCTFNTFKGDQSRCSAVPLRDTSTTLERNVGAGVGDVTGLVIGIGTDGVCIMSGGASLVPALAVGDKVNVGGKIYSVEAVAAQALTLTPHPTLAIATVTYQIQKLDSNGNVTGGVYDEITSRAPWAESANTRLSLAANEDGRDGTFANGRSTVTCLLERSDLFNLTGVPINNSRVLALNAVYDTGPNRQVTIFLKYVRLARVFLNNVEVEQ